MNSRLLFFEAIETGIAAIRTQVIRGAAYPHGKRPPRPRKGFAPHLERVEVVIERDELPEHAGKQKVAQENRGAVDAGIAHLGAHDSFREAAPAASDASASSHLRQTIDLGGDRRFRMDGDIDTEALGRVLDCVLGRR